MGITVRFVGGPADGRTLAIPDDRPPLRYLIPLPVSLAELVGASLEPTQTRAAEYEPLLQDWRPRRADDGAYLYQHRATPLSPEERRALEDKRCAARAAEEKRAAELDEAWKEIRRERPHFPPDWRGLFS